VLNGCAVFVDLDDGASADGENDCCEKNGAGHDVSQDCRHQCKSERRTINKNSDGFQPSLE
jgi:hypothetical protein